MLFSGAKVICLLHVSNNAFLRGHICKDKELHLHFASLWNVRSLFWFVNLRGKWQSLVPKSDSSSQLCCGGCRMLWHLTTNQHQLFAHLHVHHQWTLQTLTLDKPWSLVMFWFSPKTGQVCFGPSLKALYFHLGREVSEHINRAVTHQSHHRLTVFFFSSLQGHFGLRQQMWESRGNR